MRGGASHGRPSHRLAVLVFMLVVLVGCQTRFCTLMGCQNALRLSESELEVWAGSDESEIEVCVDDDCVILTDSGDESFGLSLSDGQWFVSFPAWELSDQMAVTVRASTAAGTKTATGTVDVKQWSPNGESCGPTCGSATITVTEDEVQKAD